MRAWAIGLLLLFVGAIGARADEPIKAFPPAGSGVARYVLQLPAQPDESVLKVELIVGQTIEADAHNRYFFGGRIEAQPVKGYGYTRYVVSKLGPMAGTMIAVDPKAPKVSRFVVLGGEPYFVRYNSKLPLVVYVPADAEVRYRIWSTDPVAKPMKKG
jgi:ecotin